MGKPEWLLSELDGAAWGDEYTGGQSSSWHLPNAFAGFPSLLLNRKHQNVDLESYREVTQKQKRL